MRDELTQALASGRGVTAKIRWIARPDDANDDYPGRSRWIHCTPLIGHNGQVGVWMVVLVDEDKDEGMKRRFRPAPPVAAVIGDRSRQRESSGPSEYPGRYSQGRNYSRPNTAGVNGMMGSESPNPASSELSFAIG